MPTPKMHNPPPPIFRFGLRSHGSFAICFATGASHWGPMQMGCSPRQDVNGAIPRQAKYWGGAVSATWAPAPFGEILGVGVGKMRPVSQLTDLILLASWRLRAQALWGPTKLGCSPHIANTASPPKVDGPGWPDEPFMYCQHTVANTATIVIAVALCSEFSAPPLKLGPELLNTLPCVFVLLPHGALFSVF